MVSIKPRLPLRILISPLDWGLGHATRCIPLIRILKNQNYKLFIAGDGAIVHLLAQEFPDLEIIPLSGYNITYAKSTFLMVCKFPVILFKVFFNAIKEHYALKRIVAQKHINGIISDNRFGCWHSKIWSIYITHQVTIKMPFGFSLLEPIFCWGHRLAISRFNEVWIPDLPGCNNLTGDLGHRKQSLSNVRYIGLLSRFSPIVSSAPAINSSPHCTIMPDLLIMLSGPEPQRSIFEDIILCQLLRFNGTVVVLLGTPRSAPLKLNAKNIFLFSNLSTNEISLLIQSSHLIISRAGYSTIVELVSLGKRALLVPTPGQTEQEYLCTRMEKLGYFAIQNQRTFNLATGLEALRNLEQAKLPQNDPSLLINALSHFGASCR